MNRWVAGLMVGVMLGCGAVQTPRVRLQDDLRAFEKKIRWKKWSAAAKHVTAELRADWLKQHRKAGRGLELTDVRIERVEAGPLPLKKAVVYFSIAWYRLPSMTVRERTWRQRWLHGKAGWMMMEEVALDAEGEPVTTPTDWP